MAEVHSSNELIKISNTLEDGLFAEALEAHVNVSSMHSSKQKQAVDAVTLSKKWGIGLEAAKKTLKVTTQHGVRTVLHPSLSRHFRTNDRQLQYRRLQHDVFSDTLKSNIKSK